MNTKAELKKFSEAVTTIKSITRVYEQAAARKMKTVKVEMEKVNQYLGSAVNTYSSAKVSAVSEEKQKMQAALLRAAWRMPKKKQVLVLISSQNYYYGNLIPSLFRLFINEYKVSGSDAIILGNIGREFVEKEHIRAPNITYYNFSDISPDWNVVHLISKQLSNYERIVIFYGEYRSVLTQEAKKADISEYVVVRNVDEVKKYLFRPKVEHSLSFLEQQLIAGGFLEKIYEAQVAKYAARIKILEIGQVAEKISDALSQLGRGRRKVRKNVNNKKQMQLFTGSDLWQREGLVGH